MNDRMASILMLIFIVAVQILALFMANPFETSGIKAFANPKSPLNPLIFVAIILGFTLFLFVITKLKREAVYFIILIAIAIVIYYVFIALTDNLLFSVIVAISLPILLYLYPKWYVIDLVGILLGAGVASIFGISLTIIPCLILLTVLAVYDAIAVYKTKHMVTLAKSFMETKLPILFEIPRKEGDPRIMGMGDAVIPAILAVSASFFLGNGIINLPALGTVVGTCIGFVALTLFMHEGAHAGLPFLNSGAILGFLVGFLLL